MGDGPDEGEGEGEGRAHDVIHANPTVSVRHDIVDLVVLVHLVLLDGPLQHKHQGFG